MIPRHISRSILKYAKQYPIIALVGPRQSGKTTLAKALFPSYNYVSLENLDLRHYATTDPRGFLAEFGPYAILDEVQRVPELFAYLQEKVDTDSSPAQYILTGSAQFLLMENITQSLAGRIITFKLYPLTFTELYRYPEDTDYSTLYRKRHSRREKVDQEQLLNMLLTGFFPRIHDKQLDSNKWYEGYVLTYVERDIRSLLQVKNLRTFETFLKLCASLSGQLLNYSNLSNALGISVPTVKEWLSILEASGIIFILSPFFENFSKRLVKMPKLYFSDPGLLCYLLSIRTSDHLKTHPLLGHIFETFLVSECFKRFYNLGETPALYFWRDLSGTEVDLLIYDGRTGYPIEIKLSQTLHPDFKLSIDRWLSFKNNPAQAGTIAYCGDHAAYTNTAITAVPWYQL